MVHQFHFIWIHKTRNLLNEKFPKGKLMIFQLMLAKYKRGHRALTNLEELKMIVKIRRPLINSTLGKVHQVGDVINHRV